MKLKQGDKVSFWQTINRQRTLRTGIFIGYAAYNGKAIVDTGEGLQRYRHFIKREKLIQLKENMEPELNRNLFDHKYDEPLEK